MYPVKRKTSEKAAPRVRGRPVVLIHAWVPSLCGIAFVDRHGSEPVRLSHMRSMRSAGFILSASLLGRSREHACDQLVATDALASPRIGDRDDALEATCLGVHPTDRHDETIAGNPLPLECFLEQRRLVELNAPIGAMLDAESQGRLSKRLVHQRSMVALAAVRRGRCMPRLRSGMLAPLPARRRSCSIR